MRILVTGASGFAGSTLIPPLLERGHSLRALGRDPSRVRRTLAADPLGAAVSSAALARGELEVIQGDVLTGDGLAEALRDVEVGYYLIHSMESPPLGNRSSPRDFPEREALSAQKFARAAAAAGVRRIVYLGGLLPEEHQGSPPSPSRHLSSREAVERILLDGVPGSVALRASIVIGARSRSFRFLVRLVERLPVLALPAWRINRTQPIDVRDITEMLIAAASEPAAAGRSLDVGGPEILTYEQIVRQIAELMMVGRPAVRFGVSLTPIAARVAAAIASEDPELILPLMEGLQGDLLPRDDRAAELLGVKLHSFSSAVECALGEWERVEPLSAR